MYKATGNVADKSEFGDASSVVSDGSQDMGEELCVNPIF